MILFHGTSKNNVGTILADGVIAPSYWGTEEVAHQYAQSFAEGGVVLRADIEISNLEINRLVADTLAGCGYAL